eukprot:s675_g6.t1
MAGTAASVVAACSRSIVSSPTSQQFYAHLKSMKHLCMLDTKHILQQFADFFWPTQPIQQFLRALRKATRRLAI